MATPSLVSRAARSIPIHAVPKDAYDAWLKKQRREVRTWLDSVDFSPKAHRFELVPGRDGKLEAVVVGVDSFDTPWALAGLSAKLPKGAYRLETPLSSSDATNACVGWLLGTYRFTRYKKKPPTFGASLVVPKGADVKRAELIASALRLSRDLINTPAEDMGPSELAAEARKLGRAHRARVTVIRGNELLRKNYPTIHTVGRASDDPPHLIDLVWGSASHPKVTLVGKGVCFDSGGLDLKPASGMLTMKKDMGGAAAVLGVAKLIMGARLPVRLRVLVPAVENSVSGNAYRPLDVIKTRKGITVEIGNTDAEGRLVLSDALTEACREKPDVLIDFATLTGAARV
ncbi:MAG: leucyl aminopeptidase family protein, partial [Myxococcales bacterium]|nr:leucyl aminopeptidase family protein [Myxococcales bacterium]